MTFISPIKSCPQTMSEQKLHVTLHASAPPNFRRWLRHRSSTPRQKRPNPTATRKKAKRRTVPSRKRPSSYRQPTSKMAAAIKALNAKIRSNPMLDYVCSTRTFLFGC